MRRNRTLRHASKRRAEQTFRPLSLFALLGFFRIHDFPAVIIAAFFADLMGLYAEGDVRGTMFQSKLSEKDSRTVYWTAKYFGKGLTTPDYTNTIVLRLSEMYLNRAEAIYNGASISGASTSSDIRTITSNRGAADIPNPSISDIYGERRKELAWEGHEWFDLARTGRTMTRTDSDANAAANEVRPGDTRWAMPIPRRETTVNDNLEQNPGY